MATDEGEEEGGVWFYGPYDRPQLAQLKLRNEAKHPVAFRLKCNRALHFHIKPSGVGVLQPTEAQQFALTAMPGASQSESKMMLMLELITVHEEKRQKSTQPDAKPTPKPVIDPIAVWNHLNVGNLKRTAIPIYFGADAVGDDEEEIVVVMINETMVAGQAGQMKKMYQRVQRRYPDAAWLFSLALGVIGLVAFCLGLSLGLHIRESQRSSEEQ